MPRSWSSTTGNGSSTGLAAAGGWTLGDYYQFQVDTTGFQDLAIDWDQARSSTGPGLFDLSYSLDGISFTQIGMPFGVLETWDNYSRDLSSVDLIENQATVYLRIANATPFAVGASFLDNVVISGTPMAPLDPFAWISAAGGDFGTGSNWYGGVAPVSDDTPIFEILAAYSVNFADDVANAEMNIIGLGSVTFDLQGHEHSIPFGSAMIGLEAEDNASLTITSSASGGAARYLSVNVGSNSGAFGDLIIDGSNASMATSFVTIGANGEGDATVSNGGSLVPYNPAFASEIFLGRGNDSVGTLLVTGAGSNMSGGWKRIVVGGELLMENDGQGSLIVAQGGSVAVQDLDIAAAAAEGSGASTGTVLVTGAGSAVSGGQITVGRGGTGSLTAGSGAAINVDSISVGASSHGTATIQSGAQLETTIANSISIIGSGATGNGQLTVTGNGSRWDASSQIQVGGSGTGHLTISAGGEVQSDKANSATNLSGLVAVQDGSTGTVTITGAGSEWTQDGGMSVGHRGEGMLDINSGGVLNSQDGFVGRLATGDGEATIDGANSAWNVSRSMYIGGTDTAAGGTGELIVKNQGAVVIGDTLKLWSGGTVDVSGGGRVGIGTGGPPAAGTVAVRDTGLLEGDGTIVGNVLIGFGTVRPGSPIGTLGVVGQFEPTPSGILRFEVGGTTPGTQYDRINVQGHAILGGELLVELVNGFNPQAGDSFDILDWTTSQVDGFTYYGLPNLPGRSWDISQLFTSGMLRVVLAGDFNLDNKVDAADYVVWRKSPGTFGDTAGYNAWRANFGATAGSGAGLGDFAVPEPSSGVLLALAGMGVLWKRASRIPGTNARRALSPIHASAVTVKNSAYRFGILICLLAFASMARTDIFQWEYVNPVDPSQGMKQSSVLCPGGAGANVHPGGRLLLRDLTKAYLIGADLRNSEIISNTLTSADFSDANLANALFFNSNLTSVSFARANLTLARFEDFSQDQLDGIDWSDAIIAGTLFRRATSRGFTASQLYSTASYKDRNLAGVEFYDSDFSGWDFSEQNLSSAFFSSVDLTNANFSRAILFHANLGAMLNGADITDAVINGAYIGQITAAQLYSTASYKARDLRGINIGVDVPGGWDFTGQNLAGAGIYGEALKNANMTGANIVGASFYSYGTVPATQLYSTSSYQEHNLSGIAIYDAQLPAVDFNGQNLSNAYFVSSNLNGADFSHADLSNVQFNNSTVVNANFTNSKIVGATLSNASGFTAAQFYSTANYQARDLAGVWFYDNDLGGWDLSGQNLASAILQGPLAGADFTDALVAGAQLNQSFTMAQLYSTASYQAGDLRGIALGGVDFAGVNLAGRDLSGTSLSRANLSGANLSGAVVSSGSLAESVLTNANLSGADLANANLAGSDLTNAELTNAHVAGTSFDSTTSRGFTAAQL